MKNAYKKPNGMWYSQFTNPLTGKRIRQPLSKSKVEAQILLDNIMAKYSTLQNTSVQNGTKVTSGMGWVIAMDKWTTIHLSKYGNIQRQHMVSVLDKLQAFTSANNVQEITYGDVEDFLDSFPKLKGKTINKYTRFIKKFFDFCVKRKWILRDDNPCFGIEYRDEDKYIPYHFTSEEVDKLFSTEHTFTDFWTFMIETGMRACDAKLLTQSNFHLKSDGRMYMQFKSVKTKLDLDVPISIRAQKVVESLGEILFPEGYETQFQPSHHDGFLRMSLLTMKGLLGGKNHPNHDDLKHHTFRHTFAINHLIKHKKKEVLQSLLGHTSIKTTEMFYANWIPNTYLTEYI